MRILETVITLILVSPFGLSFNYKVNRSLISQSSIFGPLTKVNASLVCCWIPVSCEILPTRIFFGDIPVGQQNASALLDTHSSACFFCFVFVFVFFFHFCGGMFQRNSPKRVSTFRTIKTTFAPYLVQYENHFSFLFLLEQMRKAG